MNNLFSNVDAWIIATVLGLLMCGGWWLGRWRTRRADLVKDAEATDQLTNASVALLGLLLAFTFSMSLERHEHRRQMVVEHSNTIGDFATCASLLREPVRDQLRGVVRKYVEHLLTIPRPDFTEVVLQDELSENERLHNEMQSLVKVAVDDGTPVVVPLVNTLNALTSSHEARLAAVRNGLPSSIVVLLCLSAIVPMIQIGMQHGRTDGSLNERELVTGLGFVILVCLCVWVTLDLNQPQRGTITISQEPLQRLLTTLNE